MPPEIPPVGPRKGEPGLEQSFEPVFLGSGNMRVGGGMFGEVIMPNLPKKVTKPMELRAVMPGQGSVA